MTTSRRDFLGIAAAGSAVAASGVFSGGTSAAPADMSQAGGRAGRYVPPAKFGLGGVPLGNEFEVVSDEDAYHTLEAAWNAGVRYYDVEGLIAAHPDALVYGDTYEGTASLRSDQDLHPALMKRYAGKRISYRSFGLASGGQTDPLPLLCALCVSAASALKFTSRP